MPHIETHFLRDDGTEFKEGDKGLDVELFQRELLNQGIDIGEDGADGDFGPLTAAGARKFRAARFKELTNAPEDAPATAESIASIGPTPGPAQDTPSIPSVPFQRPTSSEVEQPVIGLTPELNPEQAQEKGKSFLSRAGSGFVDALRAIGGENALGNPDIQQALGQIGEAIDSADPSKKPGFATALSKASDPIIAANIRKSVLATLESGGDLSEVPGIGQLSAQEITGLQKAASSKQDIELKKKATEATIKNLEDKNQLASETLAQKIEEFGLRKDITEGQLKLIDAKVKAIEDAPTLEERTAAEKELITLKANLEGSGRTLSQKLTDDLKVLDSIDDQVANELPHGIVSLPGGKTEFRFDDPDEASRLHRTKVQAAKLAGQITSNFPESVFTQGDTRIMPTNTVFTVKSLIELKDTSGKILDTMKAGEVWKKLPDGSFDLLKISDKEAKENK